MKHGKGIFVLSIVAIIALLQAVPALAQGGNCCVPVTTGTGCDCLAMDEQMCAMVGGCYVPDGCTAGEKCPGTLVLDDGTCQCSGAPPPPPPPPENGDCCVPVTTGTGCDCLAMGEVMCAQVNGCYMAEGCTAGEKCPGTLVLDDGTCQCSGGPDPIPEFSTIAIPIVSILGLLLFFNYRKRKEE